MRYSREGGKSVAHARLHVYMTVLTQVLAEGSPGKGRDIFCQHYKPQAAAEKTNSDKNAGTKDKLASHGHVSDLDANQPVVNKISPAFGL